MTRLLALFLFFCCLELKAQDFNKADSIAKVYHGVALDNPVALSFKLTQELESETEKFRALHSWICGNLKYDHRLYEQITRDRKKLYHDTLKLAKWNDIQAKLVWKKLYAEKNTICTGFALLLAQMSNAIGIECRVVDGYARTAGSNVHSLDFVNHSWNAVKLDGQWQLCDPTWSSGIVYLNGGLSFYQQDYNNGYFLTDPQFFYRNHFPSDAKAIPDYNALNEKDFTQGPILYDAAFKHKVFPTRDTKMHQVYQKQGSIVILLEYRAHLPKGTWYIALDNGFSNREIEIKPEVLGRQSLSVTYQFEKAGTYDLIIMLDNSPLASFTVDVYRN